MFDSIEGDAAKYFMAAAAQGLDTPTLLKPYVVQYVATKFGYPAHESRNGGVLTFVKDSKGHNTTRWYLDKVFGRGLAAHTETPSKKAAPAVKIPKALVASLREVLGEFDAKQIRAALTLIEAADKAAEKAAKAAEKLGS
jgi:hypothetical protein